MRDCEVECLSCGDIIHEFDAFHVNERHTDNPGDRCFECANELVAGIIVNQNLHFVGAPETPKVNKLIDEWGS